MGTYTLRRPGGTQTDYSRDVSHGHDIGNIVPPGGTLDWEFQSTSGEIPIGASDGDDTRKDALVYMPGGTLESKKSVREKFGDFSQPYVEDVAGRLPGITD
jgi:hypothetical protein